MSSVVTRLQVLRGTTLDRIGFVPLSGELVFDTDLSLMYVGDGITVGGIPFSGNGPLIILELTSNQALSGIDYAIANSSSPIEFTLPQSSTYQKSIKVNNAGDGLLTVTPFAGDTINDETDMQIEKNSSFELVPWSGGWRVW